MKRVLLFAPYFLPRRRVGALRPFRFAVHLREFGWEPTVLTLQTRGQALTKTEARLLDGIEIVEIEPPFDRTLASESQLGAAPKRSGRRRIDAGPLGALDRQFPVDTWLPLFALKRRWMADVVRRVGADALWSTGDPWSGLVAGGWMAADTGVPCVADFRDPWTLCDVRTAGRWRWSLALDRRFERGVLARASAVVFAAQQTEADYRARYGPALPPTATIYNSYDPDLLVPLRAEAAGDRRAVSEGRALTLGFFGRFRELSPARPIADALAELRRRHPAVAGRVEVHAFGPLSEADAQYADALDVRAQFRQQAPVPLEEALGALRQFDLLLVSTEPRRTEILPAKLIEGLAARRPILSLTNNPEVGRIIERTGAGVQYATGEAARTADLLAACVRAKDEGAPLPIPFAPDASAIRDFEARPATEHLAAVLETAAASGRSV